MSRRDVLIAKLSDTMDADNAAALLEEVIRDENATLREAAGSSHATADWHGPLVAAERRVAELERHDCERWHNEGLGCALCNPSAITLRESWARDPVRIERNALRARVAKLERMRTHCERCGADYMATGIEAGCPCLLTARVAELEAALVILLDSPSHYEGCLCAVCEIRIRKLVPDGE